MAVREGLLYRLMYNVYLSARLTSISEHLLRGISDVNVLIKVHLISFSFSSMVSCNQHELLLPSVASQVGRATFYKVLSSLNSQKKNLVFSLTKVVSLELVHCGFTQFDQRNF